MGLIERVDSVGVIEYRSAEHMAAKTAKTITVAHT